MKRTAIAVLLALPALCLADAFAIVNARIVPVSSPPIERGSIVVRDGRIVQVGAGISVPKDARKIDGAGLSVYPGWIDGYTTLGLSEIPSVRGSVDTAELGAFNPAAQGWVAVNPHSEMIRTSRANGITTALVAPSGGRISGTASALNLLGEYPDRMALLQNAGLVITIPSVYRAQGFGPAGGGDNAGPEARRRRVAEDLAHLKQYLREAKAYAEMRARSGGAFSSAAHDSALEAMIPVMKGQRPVICIADHFREIRTAVELGDEFGFKIVIAGGADAWKVAGLLAQKSVGVLYDAVFKLPRDRSDAYDTTFAAPELMRKAGVRFAIVSGSAADSRNLPYRAAMAAAFGLEREDALKAVTLWPAELLGIGKDTGSIEPGKFANLIVSRGDPFDIRTEIKYVFIEGKPAPLDSRNTEMFERFAQ